MPLAYPGVVNGILLVHPSAVYGEQVDARRYRTTPLLSSAELKYPFGQCHLVYILPYPIPITLYHTTRGMQRSTRLLRPVVEAVASRTPTIPRVQQGQAVTKIGSSSKSIPSFSFLSKRAFSSTPRELLLHSQGS